MRSRKKIFISERTPNGTLIQQVYMVTFIYSRLLDYLIKMYYNVLRFVILIH